MIYRLKIQRSAFFFFCLIVSDWSYSTVFNFQKDNPYHNDHIWVQYEMEGGGGYFGVSADSTVNKAYLLAVKPKKHAFKKYYVALSADGKWIFYEIGKKEHAWEGDFGATSTSEYTSFGHVVGYKEFKGKGKYKKTFSAVKKIMKKEQGKNRKERQKAEFVLLHKIKGEKKKSIPTWIMDKYEKPANSASRAQVTSN